MQSWSKRFLVAGWVLVLALGAGEARAGFDAVEVFKQLTGVDPREGVTIPIPGVYVLGPTPLSIGSEKPTEGIRVKISIEGVEAMTPLNITKVKMCDVTLAVKRDGISLSCEGKIGLQRMKYTGSLPLNPKEWASGWQITGEGSLEILGQTIQGFKATLNRHGFYVTGEVRVGIFTFKVDGKTEDWQFRTFKLEGKGSIDVPPVGRIGDVVLTLAPDGFSAGLSAFGGKVTVGPVPLGSLWESIRSAVQEFLNPLKLAEDLGKAILSGAVQAGEALIAGTKKAWDDATQAYDKAVTVFNDAVKWAEERIPVLGSLIKGLDEALNWIGGKLKDLVCQARKIPVIGYVIDALYKKCKEEQEQVAAEQAAKAAERERQDQERRDIEYTRALAEQEKIAKEKAAEEARERYEEAQRELDNARRAAQAAKIEAQMNIAAVDAVRRHGVGALLDCRAMKGPIYLAAGMEYLAKQMDKDLPAGASKEQRANFRETWKEQFCWRYWTRLPKGAKEAWLRNKERELLKRFGYGQVKECADAKPMKGILVRLDVQKWANHPYFLGQGPGSKKLNEYLTGVCKKAVMRHIHARLAELFLKYRPSSYSPVPSKLKGAKVRPLMIKPGALQLKK